MNGLFTIEDIAKRKKINIKSARNYLTQLRKQNLVERKGKIYKISKLPLIKDTGFYSLANKTPVKIQGEITHIVHGKRYTPEQAIIFALNKNESRFLAVAGFLCNHISHWSTFVKELKKNNLLPRFKSVYEISRRAIRVRRMPLRYKKIFETIESENIFLNEQDLRSYK